MGKMTA